uniref:ATP-binding protein n=1 Tax=uncultured marine group II/III euryarchaeote KM3_87_B04 TaxID=1456530 RepID=A0A075I0K6_9EURY|nr:hypothetical protein [uncultured marine group II/III euryarchaeote KM3_87_B04]
MKDRYDVDATPTLGEMLHSYSRMSYKWWFAIGELVDNSFDSYMENKEKLNDSLVVRIDYDGKERIFRISDNAYGMELEGMERAILLAKEKQWQQGIGRYGLGLKKACSWLGDEWKVITTQMGSNRGLAAEISIPELRESGANTVTIDARTPKKADNHGTMVEIRELRKTMRGRMERLVKKFLGDMYRRQIRNGEMKILWNDEEIIYQPPAYCINEKSGGHWYTTFDFPVKDLSVTCNLWVRENHLTQDGGFALFWNNRLIIPSWWPGELFGNRADHKARLLQGELNLDCLIPSAEKSEFTWEEFNQDDLIDAIQVEKIWKSYSEQSKIPKGKRGAGFSKRQKKEMTKLVHKAVGSEQVKDALKLVSTMAEEKPADIPVVVMKTLFEDAEDEDQSEIVIPGGKPAIKYVEVDDFHQPFMQATVTGRDDGSGKNILQLVINRGHPFVKQHFSSSYESYAAWKVFMVNLALIQYTHAGSKIHVETLIQGLDTLLKQY